MTTSVILVFYKEPVCLSLFFYGTHYYFTTVYSKPIQYLQGREKH